MDITFRVATVNDSDLIGALVVALTFEICELTNKTHFDIDLLGTIAGCKKLIKAGNYAAIIGRYNDTPIAVVTMSETYAGGKIGVIQAFYVLPEWSCIELCTPPLPEFQHTLHFYQKNGLNIVGGHKMRQALS